MVRMFKTTSPTAGRFTRHTRRPGSVYSTAVMPYRPGPDISNAPLNPNVSKHSAVVQMYPNICGYPMRAWCCRGAFSSIPGSIKHTVRGALEGTTGGTLYAPPDILLYFAALKLWANHTLPPPVSHLRLDGATPNRRMGLFHLPDLCARSVVRARLKGDSWRSQFRSNTKLRA